MDFYQNYGQHNAAAFNSITPQPSFDAGLSQPKNFEKARANERKGLGEEDKEGRIINPPRETSYPGKFKEVTE